MDGKSRSPVRLFTPGPVDISKQAREGLAAPVMHHRSDSFRHVLGDLLERLKLAFKTEDDVVALTSSGTGAMEAVVASLFSRGDRVLVPAAGKFSRRWAEISEAYGVHVSVIDLEPGESPSPERVVAELRQTRAVDAVLLTHCETSTGGLTDLRSVCQAVRDFGRWSGKRILTCSDCTSSLCVDELRKDDWQVDCAIGASQKGLLAPPGLSFVCLNADALARMEASDMPKFYFDLRKYYHGMTEYPFTPAVSLVCAVKQSLDTLLTLGLEKVWAACRSAADGLGIVIEAAGFRKVAAHGSNAVVAFWVGDADADEIARILSEEHDIVVAQGQQDLRGRILRVSAIGKSRAEILGFARAFEATMQRVGRRFVLRDIEERLTAALEGSRLWE